MNSKLNSGSRVPRLFATSKEIKKLNHGIIWTHKPS